MLNIAQEVFLVLFSILYGVMLQSISERQAFPLGRTLRGYTKRDGMIETEFEKTGQCGQKSNAWLKGMWRKRIGLSIIFLNIFPIVYLWFVLGSLGKVEIHAELSSSDFIQIAIIFWSALGVFGFYRVYHAIAVKYWQSLFCDIIEERFENRGVSFDARAHSLWGILFYLSPGLSYLILLNFFPAYLWMWSFFLIAIIMVIIAYCITD